MVMAALVFAGKKRTYPAPLYQFGETKSVLFLAGLCYVTGLFVNISRLFNDQTGGPGLPGLLLCAISGLGLMAVAAWLILYCLVRQIRIYREQVIMTTPSGKERAQSWQDLVRVEKPMLTRSSKLVFANGMSFSVQQSNRQYKPFMEFVKASMKGRQGRDLLRQAQKAMQGF